jgi:hypothetical protein
VRITWSFDLMVISATPEKIVEQRGYVTDFGFSPAVNLPPTTNTTPTTANTPLYWSTSTTGNPEAQIDTATAIDSCENNVCNYRDDGY